MFEFHFKSKGKQINVVRNGLFTTFTFTGTDGVNSITAGSLEEIQFKFNAIK